MDPGTHITSTHINTHQHTHTHTHTHTQAPRSNRQRQGERKKQPASKEGGRKGGIGGLVDGERWIAWGTQRRDAQTGGGGHSHKHYGCSLARSIERGIKNEEAAAAGRADPAHPPAQPTSCKQHCRQAGSHTPLSVCLSACVCRPTNQPTSECCGSAPSCQSVGVKEGAWCG